MNIRLSGDTMLLVEFEQAIDQAVNEAVIRLGDRLRTRLGRQVRDIVPAYASLGIHFDPLLTDLVALERAIEDEAGQPPEVLRVAERPAIEIPVRYGGEDGPDLEAVAEFADCEPEEVIQLHASQVYRVYMLGFVPGFAYLGRVDGRIAAPRHRVPRDRVPAGAVGIAGEQTGVYPISTPGGWQLIGRTDVRMFDLSRPEPSLLHPGDRVRFLPVPPASYP
ncbi:MAG: 5-oxoprolinase subunit PxpB [Acidobacteriota bacterium]